MVDTIRYRFEVEAHALNWYVAMLQSTLSVQLPYLPVYWATWNEKPRLVSSLRRCWRRGFKLKNITYNRIYIY